MRRKCPERRSAPIDKGLEIQELTPAFSRQARAAPPTAPAFSGGSGDLARGLRDAVGWLCPGVSGWILPQEPGYRKLPCNPRSAERWNPPGARRTGRGPLTWRWCSAWPRGCCRPSSSTCRGIGCFETCAPSPGPHPLVLRASQGR